MEMFPLQCLKISEPPFKEIFPMQYLKIPEPPVILPGVFDARSNSHVPWNKPTKKSGINRELNKHSTGNLHKPNFQN